MKPHPMIVLVAAMLALCTWALHGLARDGAVARQLFAAARHVSDLDEPEDSRAERLDRFAQAIESNAASRESRAALLTLNHFEAKSARYVFFPNVCPPKACDAGRATGPWQLHHAHGIHHDLDAQAQRALGAWRTHLKRCGSIEGAFAGYATGGRCTWVGASKRAEKFREIAGRL